jgi:molybdenum cofactor cytidylyltransferase
MTGTEGLKIGAIILAAGGSSRLGQPKQFLEFEGKTLLRRAAEALVASNCNPVVAVLGAEKEKAESELAGLPVRIIENPEWRTGMSSSIKVGLKKLLSIDPGLDAVVITLCDQPFVSAETLGLITDKFAETNKRMVAARYEGVAAVPALFSREMFDALSKLSGDKGARDLLRDPNALIETVDIDKAAVDIDTPDDIHRLK